MEERESFWEKKIEGGRAISLFLSHSVALD